MSIVKVAAFAVSLDGFGAGPNQSLSDPLGQGGPDLHQWFFPTRTFRSMHGPVWHTSNMYLPTGFRLYML